MWVILSDGIRVPLPEHLSEYVDQEGEDIHIPSTTYNELLVVDKIRHPKLLLTIGMNLISTSTELTEAEETIIKKCPILTLLASHRQLIQPGTIWGIRQVEVWLSIVRHYHNPLQGYHIDLICYLTQGLSIPTIGSDSTTVIYNGLELRLHMDINLDPIIPRLVYLTQLLLTNDYDPSLLYPIASSVKLFSRMIEGCRSIDERIRLTTRLLGRVHSTVAKYNICVEMGNIYYDLLRIDNNRALQFIYKYSFIIYKLGITVLINTIREAPALVQHIITLTDTDQFGLLDIMEIFISENYPYTEYACRLEWNGERIGIRRSLSGLRDGKNRDLVLTNIFDNCYIINPEFIQNLAHKAVKYGNVSVIRFLLERVDYLRLAVDWKYINRLDLTIIEQFIPLISSSRLYITVRISGSVRVEELEEIIRFPYHTWLISNLEFYSLATVLNLSFCVNLQAYVYSLVREEDTVAIAQTLSDNDYDKLLQEVPTVSRAGIQYQSSRLFDAFINGSTDNLNHVIISVITEDNIDEFNRLLRHMHSSETIIHIHSDAKKIIESLVINEILRRMCQGEYTPMLMLTITDNDDIGDLESSNYLPQLTECITYSDEQTMDIAFQCGPLWNAIAHHIPNEYLTTLLERYPHHREDLLEAYHHVRIRI